MWKVNRRRTTSDGKSSHCLWQGELKNMSFFKSLPMLSWTLKIWNPILYYLLLSKPCDWKGQTIIWLWWWSASIFYCVFLWVLIFKFYNREMKMLTNEKKGKPMYPLPLYLHLLAVWTKFDILISKYFVKKRKYTEQRKTFISWQ